MGDRILDTLRRKLEKLELQHLRQHAADLAARLERAEETAEHEREVAEYWWETATNMIQEQMEAGETVGLTKSGEIIIAPKAPSIAIPDLLEGERYVKTLIDANTGTGYHLTLLAIRDQRDNWQAQKDWAVGLDADLPNRVESAILFAELADQFEDASYWTNEPHSSEPGWAWYQDFYYGTQSSNHTTSELFACAVRRLPI